MTSMVWMRGLVAGVALSLAACSSGSSDPAGTLVGVEGGSVLGPDGAQVVIPPGALAAETLIAIAKRSAGAPALPAGFTARGEMFELTPHGVSFAVPVTVSVPYVAASVPAGSLPALYKTDSAGVWQHVSGAVVGADLLTAQVSSFSYFDVGDPGLLRNEPLRDWSLWVTGPGNHPLVSLPAHATSAVAPNGLLSEQIDMGIGLLDVDGDEKRAVATSPAMWP